MTWSDLRNEFCASVSLKKASKSIMNQLITVISEEASDIASIYDVKDIQKLQSILNRTVVVQTEQDYPIVYGQTYFPEIVEALDHLDQERVFELFELSDLCDLGIKNWIIKKITSPGSLFMSSDELAVMIEGCINILKENQSELIERGYVSIPYTMMP